MKPNPVGWFEIYVDDMERAQAFYENVFETKLAVLQSPAGDHITMRVFDHDMSRYGAGGALVKIPGFEAGKNSVLVYFSSLDCAAEEKRVLEYGGRVEKSKFSIGEHGFISLVYDTEGNLFGLHSQA